MSILPSKFYKLVPAIGFIYTGSDTSMIDPSVLSSDYWEPHLKLFRAINGETFQNHFDYQKIHWYLILSKLYNLEKYCSLKTPL